MDGTIAERVAIIVASYEAQNPGEFAAFKEQKKLIAETMDNEFASVKGEHAVQRQLFTVPEALFGMIKMGLSDEEYKEIWGNDPSAQGAIWFARTFPQYRTGRKL